MTDRSEKSILTDEPEVLAAVRERLPDPATIIAVGYGRGLHVVSYATPAGPKRHAVKVCDRRYLVDAIVDFFEARANG